MIGTCLCTSCRMLCLLMDTSWDAMGVILLVNLEGQAVNEVWFMLNYP